MAGPRRYIVRQLAAAADAVEGRVDAARTRARASYRLRGDRVLLVRAFVLEDPGAAQPRAVDVPSPMAGRVSKVLPREGVVEVSDARGAWLLRVRHLGPIVVAVGDVVVYGQSLGTQGGAGAGREGTERVRIEMDIRHEEALDDYLRDLVDGRLPVEARHRAGVVPRMRTADRALRVGDAGARIADVQRALAIESPSRPGAPPRVAPDGIYRLTLQAEVLRFQERHDLVPTGDVDWSTWRRAIAVIHRAHPVSLAGVGRHARSPYRSPYDALHDRIRAALDHLERQSPEAVAPERSERLGHALVAAVAGQGMDAFDRLVLGPDRRASGEGQAVFLLRGTRGEPGYRRVHADSTSEVPLEEVLAIALASVDRALARPPDSVGEWPLIEGEDRMQPERGPDA